MGAVRRTSADKAEIKRLRVHPDMQRRGFGQQILSELEIRAAGLGYRVLHLDTTTNQVAAQALFAKNGYDDPDHSLDEKRFISIGTSSKQRILFIAHADRGQDHVRIIHTRPATKTEAHAHQESRK